MTVGDDLGAVFAVANWFDELAKRSARRSAPATTVGELPSNEGVSRRDVIVKGAAVAGVAWTAPMLMSTRAYAFGVSTCPPAQICGDPAQQQVCCQPNDNCLSDNGTPVCAPPQQPGGVCVGNNGSGTSGCVAGVFCNGNANSNNCRCTKPNTCGGYGSTCTSGSTAKQCSPGFVCSGGFCRPSCTTPTSCPQDLLLNPPVGTALVCVNSVCQQTCVPTPGQTSCPAGQSCTGGFCV